MQYKYEVESKNYADFASGRVIYNQKGATAFPVRLGSEIFLRSKNYLDKKIDKKSISIYDPCCGGGYLLTILGFLHGKYISKIIASDIDEEMVNLAKRNIFLLTSEGINKRIKEIKEYIEKYNKESHKKALNSALKLKYIQKNMSDNIKFNCFKANALKIYNYNFKVDLVLSDLPYGNITEWSQKNNSTKIFLNNLLNVLNQKSIVTIITAKKQKINHRKYNRIKHFTIGKRRISFLEKL